jgi:hypothetical protein
MQEDGGQEKKTWLPQGFYKMWSEENNDMTFTSEVHFEMVQTSCHEKIEQVNKCPTVQVR